MPPDEIHIAHDAPRPKGYGFLKKGNPFMTALCRRKTHAAGMRLYIVSARKTPVGLLAPRPILDNVFAEERRTRHRRSAAVERRDGAVHDKFDEAIRRLFPKMPPREVPDVLKQTLKKKSGRVGRTGTLALDDKVRLAVVAHARHRHTDYDKMLSRGTEKWEARKAVADDLTRVLGTWGARATERMVPKKKKRGTQDTCNRKGKKVPSPTKTRARLPAKPAQARFKSPRTEQSGKTASGPRTRSRTGGQVPEVIVISDSDEWSGQETEDETDSDAWEDSADEYE
ncbi:hypothetical protein HIM_05118 [Hirsutella minnesotensis 3608]|uniref:DUF2293 domain-containing protein n=1 Tax=Hirsutella minnesotensis 3608 TaxID=1043627 RepID=A0A0F8A0K7_9HYPO|nr:hypothetical protein HIM_05118 [Hirsutella minnesotensis 3608]